MTYSDQEKSQEQRQGWLHGLRKRLAVVILLAFAVPYLCMISLILIVNGGLLTIKTRTNATYSHTNDSLSIALATTEKMFKLSAIQKAETLAGEAAMIVSLRNLIESEIPSDPHLLEMVQTERIGQDSQISIINPILDKVLLDKFIDSGENLSHSLPLVVRVIQQKDYLRILGQLRENPSVQGNIGTVSEVYREVKGKDGSAYIPVDENTSPNARPGTTPGESEEKFIVVTPIKGTPYSLSVVSSMGGLTASVLEEVQDSLAGINKTLLQIDEESLRVTNTSYWILLFSTLFGIMIMYLLFRITNRRILTPVKELKKTAYAIRGGDYSRRVRLSMMSDDFMELGSEINRMLEDITVLIQSEEDRKKLQQNIMSLLNIVSKASEGDLTQRSPVTVGVLGAVVDGLNMLLESMSTVIAQVKESGRKISMASNSIMDASRKIAVDAKRQGREIHHITSLAQQATRQMQRVSISADMANEEVQRATVSAKDGASRVNDTIQNMLRMRSNVQSTAKTIKMLGDRSLEINAIVELINDISARTNILSLNASIEASKAGEQGKGFAVVADEIRKLAERTTNATKEISSLIEDIQIETNDAVLSMEEVTHDVEQGWSQTDQAGNTLKQIESVILSAAEKILEISKVSRTMVTQMDEMVEEIKSIYQVSKETTEGIYRTTNETTNLMSPLNTLNVVIRNFRLRSELERNSGLDWMIPGPSMEERDRVVGIFEQSDFAAENAPSDSNSERASNDDETDPTSSTDE